MSALKQQAAKAAMAYIPEGEVVGVGTGSTVDYFIDCLAEKVSDIPAVVASSEQSKHRLEKHGFHVLPATSVDRIAVYVDGADEVDARGYCIKGGGGALTQEKIVASIAERFVCIVDHSKWVSVLGANFPIAIEVIPSARSLVGRALVAIGGNPVYRSGFVTDNGNIIIDVYGLDCADIYQLDKKLNQMVGVVCHGLFVAEKPNMVLIAKPDSIETVCF